MSEIVNKKSLFFDSQFLSQLERLAILSRQMIAGQLQGERRSPKKGQSVEFSDFRPYTLGDDFRRIDWNAYARLEKFFIKLFVEEEDITVYFLLDTSASMNWGNPNKFDYSIRAAAALGYIALVGLDRTTAYALGQTKPHLKHFPPHRGKRQAHKYFSYLENIHPAKELNFVKEIIAFRSMAKQPGPLVFITDLYNPQWKEALSTLSNGKFEISLLHILSPDEINPGFTGDIKLLDIETNEEIEITADYDLIQRYKNQIAHWKDEIELFCSQRGIHYIPLETTLHLQELLFSVLRRQTVLK